MKKAEPIEEENGLYLPPVSKLNASLAALIPLIFFPVLVSVIANDKHDGFSVVLLFVFFFLMSLAIWLNFRKLRKPSMIVEIKNGQLCFARPEHILAGPLKINLSDIQRAATSQDLTIYKFFQADATVIDVRDLWHLDTKTHIDNFLQKKLGNKVQFVDAKNLY